MKIDALWENPAAHQKLLPLLRAVDERLAHGRQVILSLDGPCGAGKSTLAARLGALYEVNIIAMDHFFLPPEKRTPERLAEPGGNLDYERFAQEVVPFLGGEAAFTHRVFSCKEMAFTEVRDILCKPITICEGSYSRHPAFGDPYDLRVFVTCPPEEQRRRLKARSPALFDRFVKEWIPMEEIYFTTFSVREKSDFIIDTGTP